MKISAVIPTIGTSKWLDDSIHSCLVQDEPFHEILIVDNSGKLDVRASSKFADEPGLRWEQVKPARLPAHRNWDQAIRLARGEYVVIHGDDDILYPFFTSTSRQALEQGYQIVFNGFSKIDEGFVYAPGAARSGHSGDAGPAGRITGYTDIEFFLARTLGAFQLRVVGVVFPASLYERVGGLVNSNMPREWYTDDLLWFRMASYCGRVAQVAGPAWAYRWVQDWAGNIQSAEAFTDCFSGYVERLQELVNPASRISAMARNPEFIEKYQQRCTAVWEQFAGRG